MAHDLLDTISILEDIYLNIYEPSMAIQSINLKDENALYTLYGTIIKLGLIDITSYLDEYNNVFASSLKDYKGEAYRNAFMECLKPIKAAIQQSFPDLGKFRNNYLAHPRRIQAQQHRKVILYGDIASYKVPQDFGEYIFICQMIDIMHHMIRTLFPVEIRKGKAIMYEHYGKLDSSKRTIADFENWNRRVDEAKTKWEEAVSKNMSVLSKA